MGPLIRRILRQMKNDKRSLAMLLIMPLAIIGLLFLLLGDSDFRPVVAVDGSVPAVLADAIGEQELSVVSLTGDGDEKLRTGEVDAVIAFAEGNFVIRMAEAGGGANGKVMAALRAALAEAQPGGKMEATYLYGDADASLFDNLGYVFLAVISFFVVFVLSGVSFIRERTGGTLERMMLTPVRRYQVVLGYTAGFGLLATVQSLFIVLFCRYVLGLDFAGPLVAAMAIMVLLAFAAVATGTFISIFANNEFQMVQFIPVVLIPQIFFSGLLPVETFPFHLGNLAYLMPIYYGATALNRVMVKGYGLLDNGLYLVALVVYIVALSVLNVMVLKKYRRI